MADKMGDSIETTIMPGGRGNYGKGSSGEGALDGSPGDNEDSEGGSSGSGWRGGNPQRPQGTTGPGRDPDDHTARSEGSTRRPGENRLAKFRDSGEGSTGSGISAVQAPNRPR